MPDQDMLFLTELLGLKVFDLKGRRIGVVKDAAIVPLDGSGPRRSLSDRRRRGLADRPPRSGALHFARRHPPSRRKPDSVSFRRVHAAHGRAIFWTSRSSMRRAARWCASTIVTFEIRHENDGDSPVGAGRRYRPAQHFPPPGAGRAAAALGPAIAGAGSRRIPFAGNSATFWSPIRSGACG